MDDAVGEFTAAQVEATGLAPIPPCIHLTGDGVCQITLEIEDQDTQAKILKISADCVRISITNTISHNSSQTEILTLFTKVSR